MVIDVKKLPEVPNVCNQVLREVWKSKDVSVAHVVMASGNTSLLHHHSSFTELYYILRGRGIIYVGGVEFPVWDNYLVEVKPNVKHKLQNIGLSDLEHLVISTPAFNADDVVIDNE